MKKLKEHYKKKGFKERYEKIKYDGYLLNIDSDKIIIIGNEKRGVLYGIDVLLDIIKMTTGEIGPPIYAQECLIVDWPDFKTRVLTDDIQGYMRVQKVPPELYCDMLEKFPLKFRYNEIGIGVSCFYHWECAPTIRLKQGWTGEEFRKIIKFVNTRYVNVFPMLFSHGHMEWLLNFPEYAHLREDGDRFTLCTKNPVTYPTLFAFYDELIKITSENPEYKSKYFLVGLDEVSWKTFEVPPEKRCKYCEGIPKNEIYLEHINKLADYLRKKGYRMVMYTDMLVEQHNGFNQFKCALIRDKLPKDIIAAHWSYLDEPAIPEFEKLGIENWKLTTGCRINRIYENMITARGIGVFAYNWWLSMTRGMSLSLYGPMAQAIYANAAWNIFPDDKDYTWKKYERIYGNFLMHNWSRKPLLYCSKEVKTIDISSIVNTTCIDKDGNGWFGLGEKFDLSLMDFSKKEIDGIPFKFSFRENIPMCIKLKNKDDMFSIKIGEKFGSLILLHVAHINSNIRLDRSNYFDNPYGPPIVKYTIKYKDGTSTDFTINFGWNISLWKINSTYKNSIFSKYVVDSRSIWEGYTKDAKEKNLPPDIAIYQYEWVNPYPEKEIETISLEKLIPEPVCNSIEYALLAISGRLPK
ncbi:MAG: family 20 glycosylhydrolase [Candidatus Omnitrophica bacterium]|nr:family 20 glycosylhydrolase [Candidatus Omnitrophota bacterium]